MRLLVITEGLGSNHPIWRLLGWLGIAHERAYLFGTQLHTRAGVLSINANACRNYLRQFDAVLAGLNIAELGVSRAHLNLLYWLNWSDPQDPSIVYVGAYPRAGLSAIEPVPSDFPIIRPDPSNPSTTTFEYTGSFLSSCLCVRLTRENTELYTHAAQGLSIASFTNFLHRLDLAKHAALGAQGEILALPVSEDISFPQNVVVAYRYKNHYLLPCVGFLPAQPVQFFTAGAFWVYYALKLLGVPASQSVPLFYAIDDAIAFPGIPTGAETIAPTDLQMARIGYETYRHLAEAMYPRCGLVSVSGVLTGGRYRTGSIPEGSYWEWVVQGVRRNPVRTFDADTRDWVARWHQLFVRHYYTALPCTPHDHSLYHHANRTFTSFRRHTDAGFPHAAPNDVPITRGSTLVKASVYTGTVPAGAREREIGGELYYEWGFSATSGATDTIASITPNNIYAARVVHETSAAEMIALGFPDWRGGDNPLMITPGGQTGDVSVWRQHREWGFRVFRAQRRSLHTPPDTNPVHYHQPTEDIWFLLSVNLDASNQFDMTFGLYHPSFTSRTAVGALNIDFSGDISSLWDTDRPLAARRAYRRAIGMYTEQWLRCAHAPYATMIHPVNSITWADANDPTRPFDPNDPDCRINFMLEIAWNLEKVVKVLHPYLKFGTVKEYVAMRERVMI